MATDYAKVLTAQQVDFDVIGRGSEKASFFTEAYGKKVRTGGLSKWLSETGVSVPAMAIVAVNVECLADITSQLLQSGVKSILVEKPGGLNCNQIRKLHDEVKKTNGNVYLGYNRRFYTATKKAEEIIQTDGGVSSFSFEFTEWAHVIGELKKAPEVKANWFLANSTHVVDLAFYLGGKPREISSYLSGGLEWHPSASIWAGAGITREGALFSYQSNWDAPGRWGVEILTKKNRLIFRPMEKLQVQKKGSVAIVEVEIDDTLDREFKPGLYRQVEAFFNQDGNSLLSMEEHVQNLEFYELINTGNAT